MARVAKSRTSFDVPGVGAVTLAAGEECPKAWEPHAPRGALKRAPRTPPPAPPEPPPNELDGPAADGE